MLTDRKFGPKSRIKLALDRATREMRGLNNGTKYGAGLASEGYVGGYVAALSDVLLVLDKCKPCVRPQFWETGRK